jgi:hypothetical protein
VVPYLIAIFTVTRLRIRHGEAGKDCILESFPKTKLSPSETIRTYVCNVWASIKNVQRFYNNLSSELQRGTMANRLSWRRSTPTMYSKLLEVMIS